ncbi:MAG: hypothetical protein ABL931_18810 [Usitatibacteraceae bacterium]
MALTEKAKEYTSNLQLRVQLEDLFKRLAKRNKVEAQLAIIAQQRILQNAIQTGNRNVG